MRLQDSLYHFLERSSHNYVTYVLVVMQVAKTVDEHISAYAQVTLETVAYANSGDVLKVQALLSLAGEHIEVEEDTQWKVCP